MPRLKEETTKLVTFRVSDRLHRAFAEAVKDDERTVSAALRHHMQARVNRAGRQERKAA